MEKTKVAIVGLGTVGSGVARLLLDHADRPARHAGRRLWLEQVVVQDLTKPRDVEVPAGILSDDLTRITRDKEISVVAHLVGGLEPARQIFLDLLESGKDVVTANKALLAEHGPELFDRARELGRSIAFEASVAGGIPIIANISQCLSANQVLSIHGILNGTSNFILTKMEEQGVDYPAALAEAQKRGFAEADPTMDVDGSDATQKLAILAHLAFGSRVHWRDISRSGIDNLQTIDLRYARELGYRIKLLATAQLTDGKLEMHVSPTMVKAGTPLAEVRGAFNAVSIEGDAVGDLFFQGLGAGQMPTASAVMADMIDTVLGRSAITFRALQAWSKQEARVEPLAPTAAVGRYYLRFNVDDRPGVLGEIAGVLGQHQISIASVIQHDEGEAGQVPLVIMTHSASDGAVQKALATIDRLGFVRAGSVKMRVRNH